MNEEELTSLLWECVKDIPYVENVQKHEKDFAIRSLMWNLKHVDFGCDNLDTNLDSALRKSWVMYQDFENEIMGDIVAVLKQRFCPSGLLSSEHSGSAR